MSDSFVPSPLLQALGTSGDSFTTRMAAMLCLLGRIRKQKILPEDVTSSMKSLVIMGYDHKVYSLLEQYGFFSGASSRVEEAQADEDEEEEEEEEEDYEDEDDDDDEDDEDDDEEEEIEEVLEGSDADDLMKMLPDLSNLDSLSLDELTQTKEMLLGIEQMLAKQQNEVEQLTRQQETMRSYLATRAE